MTHDGAFTNQAVAETKQVAMMAQFLDNLANAAIQKNDTVEKLVIANKCLAKVLANANTAIACLHLLGPMAPQTGIASNACPAHWAATPPGWDPHGYCWTHVWKVKLRHSSATCTHQKEGHNTTATCTNTKDGSRLNKAWTPA